MAEEEKKELKEEEIEDVNGGYGVGRICPYCGSDKFEKVYQYIYDFKCADCGKYYD